MTAIFKKPLLWSNVVSLTFVGVVAAGLAFGWNNPSAAPIGGNGAIRTDASGNVRIGGIGNPLSKLHVSGDLLVDAGGGITLGGIERNNWLTNGSSFGCDEVNPYFFCVVTANDKVYGINFRIAGPTSPPTLYISSVDTLGVLPSSTVGCSEVGDVYFFCIIAASGNIYGINFRIAGPTSPPTLYTSSVSASGVIPNSEISCSEVGGVYFFCNIAADNKVYGINFRIAGPTSPPTLYISSVSAPGVTAPQ